MPRNDAHNAPLLVPCPSPPLNSSSRFVVSHRPSPDDEILKHGLPVPGDDIRFKSRRCLIPGCCGRSGRPLRRTRRSRWPLRRRSDEHEPVPGQPQRSRMDRNTATSLRISWRTNVAPEVPPRAYARCLRSLNSTSRWPSMLASFMPTSPGPAPGDVECAPWDSNPKPSG